MHVGCSKWCSVWSTYRKCRSSSSEGFHLVKGFTRERYPCVLGNGPVPNLIGGWLCLTAAMVLGFAVFKAVSNTYS